MVEWRRALFPVVDPPLRQDDHQLDASARQAKSIASTNSDDGCYSTSSSSAIYAGDLLVIFNCIANNSS
jgi:hypothetical protein